jgi:hypothetical protein
MYKLALVSQEEAGADWEDCEERQICVHNLRFLFKDVPFVRGTAIRLMSQVQIL